MSNIQLPAESRVWVFQADRKFTEEETTLLHSLLQDFVSGWKAHGKELSAGYEIFMSFAVFIAVDEMAENPSGCSIDKVFRLLTEFGSQHQIDFFNRLNLVFLIDGQPKFMSKNEAEIAFENKIIHAETPVLDIQITQLIKLQKSPWILFGESWLGKKLSRITTL